MNGLPDRKITEDEVRALRQSDKFAEVEPGYRYAPDTEIDKGFSKLEVTLNSGETKELMYFGENGEWEVVKETMPSDTGNWECEACGEEIWGERGEPPLDHIHNCEDAGPQSLSFYEQSD